MDTVAVGIDFGTSTSSVAVWQNGKVEIIANDQGDRTCPAYIAFTNAERLIGDVALHQIAVNPSNTVFDAKRFIGRKMKDSRLQQDMKFWPFKVINTENKVKIQVEHRGEVKRFTSEEISSVVLSKLKETAEEYLGAEVRDAVISIPTQFNNSQRQAMIDAGKIAGLNVLRLIDEPTATSLAYGLNNDIKGERHIVIFDLGGGTCDASVVSIVENSFVVRSTAGNAHLGGVDFDQRLTNYLIEECKRKFQKDLRSDMDAIRLLRDAAEKAKRALSTSVEACIEIAGLTDDIDFFTTISRSRFERICADLFRATLLPLDQALIDAKLNKLSIDDVVLVGGSTTMPMVQFLIRKFFNGRIRNLCNNLKEPVAYGAAVQAAILTGDNTPIIQNLTLTDITGLSIGYETHGCVMTNLIVRHTTKPCKKTQVFTTHADNQEVLTVDVYEGERVVTKFNNYLGAFKLSEITPDTRGKAQIEVSFDIDANGILVVSAKEVRTRSTRDLVVTDDTCRLTEPEIEQMRVEAEMCRIQDRDRRENVIVKNYYQAFMYKTKQSALSAGSKISEQEKLIVTNSCDSGMKWLEDNPEAVKEQCHDKLEEFQREHCDILTKLHASGDASPTVEDY